MIMTEFTQRSKSINFFQTTTFCHYRCKFQKRTIDVYTVFLAVISVKKFFVFFVLVVWHSGMCIPKAKNDKHKGGIKTHQQRKIWKQRNPHKKKRKKNVQKMHLKTSCNKSLGKLKGRKENHVDEKAVLLMVLWVRVDSNSFISLLSI